jgi:hypothetical protein
LTVHDTWFRLIAVMITTSKQTTLKQSGDFKSVSFGIKESGLSHIFNVLRNQLYSDKALAVIREYSTNAVDAHIEVGKADTPIKVTLPTQLTPEFKVRDFGRGLTENQVCEIYAMYGESTKRGTNEQIGQLGLGSKSAFAYGDNFIINSFVEGEKTTYNAFIDPSDVGQISKIHSEKTTDPDGVEIVIPVKSKDFGEFYKKAVRLYKYFKIVPDIKGANQDELKNDLKKDDVVIGKDNWSLVKGDSYAVMGNIAYPLDYSTLNLGWQTDEAELINSGVVINFDIGDLEISASREALQYTEGTKSAIINKLHEIIKALPDVLGEQFKECESLWEVKKLYNQAFSHGGFGQKIRKIVETKGIMWNGIKVTNGNFSTLKWSSEKIEVIAYRRPNGYGRSKRVSGDPTTVIYAKETSLVIIDDALSHHGRMNRIAPLLEKYVTRDQDHKDTPIYDIVYVIKFKSSKAEQEFKDEQKLDFPAKNLTDYPKIVLRDIYPSNTTVAGGSNLIKNSKHSTKVFSLNKKCDKGSYHTCRSDFFESNQVDLNEGGVYVIVDKFYWSRNRTGEKHPAHLVQKVQALVNVGIDVPVIYAMKPTDKNFKAVDDAKWTYFEDWAIKAFQKHIDHFNYTESLYFKLVAENHLSLCRDSDYFCEALINIDERKEDFVSRLPDSLAKTYLTRFADMHRNGESKEDKELKNLVHAFHAIGESKRERNHYRTEEEEKVKELENPETKQILDHCLGEKYSWLRNPENDLNAMNKEYQKRYRMINLMDDAYYIWKKQDKAIDATIEYITIVESTFNIKKKIKTAKVTSNELLKKHSENIFSQTNP